MNTSAAVFEAHAYGVIQNADGKVLFMKSTDGLKKFMFPGGTVEIGETTIAALKREIKEETNLEVEITELLHIETLNFKTPPQLAIYYSCKNPKGEFKLSSEHNEYVWEFPSKFDAKLIAHPSLLEVAKNQ